MEKILLISLKLNFTPNSLSRYGYFRAETIDLSGLAPPSIARECELSRRPQIHRIRARRDNSTR